MVKGKYVAKIEIYIHYDDEKIQDLKPFDETKHDICGGAMTQAIAEVIKSEIGDPQICDVSVTQEYADLYKCEGEQV